MGTWKGRNRKRLAPRRSERRFHNNARRCVLEGGPGSCHGLFREQRSLRLGRSSPAPKWRRGTANVTMVAAASEGSISVLMYPLTVAQTYTTQSSPISSSDFSLERPL